MENAEDQTEVEATDAENPDRIALHGLEVIQQALLKLLQLARREVLMIMPTMPLLLNDQNINQSLLDFVRYSGIRQVQILLNTLDELPASQHLTIRLAQRLSSRIQLRQTTALLEAPVKPNEYLFIADRKHFIRIDNIKQCSGWFNANAAFRAEQFASSLLQQWPRSQEIREFRQFHL